MTTTSREALGEVVERERPSLHGVYLGQVLTALADAGYAIDPSIPERCATCAFSAGCMTNMMAATGIEALNIAIGIDKAVFGCHHGMKDGEPTRLCAGALAAKAAPFAIAKAAIVKLDDQLASLPEIDPVRTAFDAWVAQVDPDGAMDDYQRGRLFLRAKPLSTLTGDPS